MEGSRSAQNSDVGASFRARGDTKVPSWTLTTFSWKAMVLVHNAIEVVEGIVKQVPNTTTYCLLTWLFLSFLRRTLTINQVISTLAATFFESCDPHSSKMLVLSGATAIPAVSPSYRSEPNLCLAHGSARASKHM